MMDWGACSKSNFATVAGRGPMVIAGPSGVRAREKNVGTDIDGQVH
jgi:hypothetical protein